MRWEIIDKTPKIGDIRFVTRFAFLPTRVLSKITMTDHWIWMELYVAEQVYSPCNDGWDYWEEWKTVGKTIHI